MKRVFVLLLAVAVIGALILVGCAKKTPSATTTTTQTQTSTSTTTKTTTTTTTTPTPHKVLKIGCIIGLNSPTGIEEKKWYDLFAKLVNEQGGWKIGADTYDVEMIIYDSQNDPAKGKSYLEKAVLQDGVKFILGSPTNNPATDAEVTEPNKVILLGWDFPGTSADPKLQYYYTPGGMFFGMGQFYIFYNDMEANGAKSYAELKTDDMIGHIADGWLNAMWAIAAPNVKYAGTVFFDPTTSDFGPVATKLITLNPDVIDCNYNALGASLYNALYDAGYKGKILPALDPTIFEAIKTHCGTAFMEGWVTAASDAKLYPGQPPEIQALIDAYMKEYGTWQPVGHSWVAPWFVLKDAIDNTQSVDVDVIKAYLDKQPHPVRTLTGYCQLFARPDKGNLRTISGSGALLAMTIKDGELVPLKMVTNKDTYLATIMSNNLVDVYKAYWEEYGYPKFPDSGTSTVKFSDLGITGQD